jgi:uncharacterized protein (DUF488 family)
VKVRVSTIGFTQTSAKNFFDRLERSSTKTLIDVRLHNTSQLSGFAKSDDLKFFLSRISGIDYRHLPILAPDDRMLKKYKKSGGTWAAYEIDFLDLMRARQIERKLRPEHLDGACLLCSEHAPDHCHRRLVVEYLNREWGGQLEVMHL